MYCKFYGFSEEPFSVTPDPSVFYQSALHREVLASLVYGIRQRRGFLSIVGEPGTGKTTLLRSVMNQVNENTEIAFIFNTDVTFEQLLNLALVELDLTPESKPLAKVEAINRLNEFAIQQLTKARNIALIIDEAQNLDVETLEKLRLLSNLETSKHKLIQIILSGQPELDVKLDSPELVQLRQRISVRRCLAPLDENSTYEYIQHRLAAAGYCGAPIFSHRARHLVWKYSGGVPRKINVLCDNALLIGYALGNHKIESDAVQEVIGDLDWKPSRKKRTAGGLRLGQIGARRLGLYTGAAMLATIVVAALVNGFPLGRDFGVNLWSGIAARVANDSRTHQSTMMRQADHLVGDQMFSSVSEVSPEERSRKDQGATVAAADSAAMTVQVAVQVEPRVGSGQNGMGLENEQQNTDQTIAQMQEAESLVSQQTSTSGAPVNPVPAELKVGAADSRSSSVGEDSDSSFQQLEELISELDRAAVVEQSQENGFVIVKRGDTLSRLIRRFYGRFDNELLQAVLQENPGLKNLNHIEVGQSIRLPRNLLKKRDNLSEYEDT